MIFTPVLIILIYVFSAFFIFSPKNKEEKISAYISRTALHPILFGIFIFIISYASISFALGPTKCKSGWRSPSIGIQGACSHHGGVDRTKGQISFWGALAIAVIAGYYANIIKSKQEIAAKKEKIEPLDQNNIRDIPPKNESAIETRSFVACPSCGAPMGKRLARRGRRAGKYFMGCSRYPECSGTRNL